MEFKNTELLIIRESLVLAKSFVSDDVDSVHFERIINKTYDDLINKISIKIDNENSEDS